MGLKANVKIKNNIILISKRSLEKYGWKGDLSILLFHPKVLLGPVVCKKVNES